MKDLIRRLEEHYGKVREDNVTADLDGGLGQPKTPFAFEDPDHKKKKKALKGDAYVNIDVTQGGDTTMYSEKIYKDIDNILAELSYNDFKNDDAGNSRQKINNSISEIGKKLREVEIAITHASKLKTETGADQSIFWKSTQGKFAKINERLIRLSTKIREFNT